ncbi:glycoside hydrolase family 99-like domain-containing protein [Ruegeria sp. HKCCD9179]|uniref:glycoside hydrolase family 99-like domain-containing protein n=1 Tax=unclassified Ruegeria TaxID=2625375 RepID=UPI0014876950|nr:hypothetical protein [Ruegeria sp. HKCCD6109]
MFNGRFFRRGTTQPGASKRDGSSNGIPGNYEYLSSSALRQTALDFPNQERFVYVNAWKEGAEGCHFEPEREYGHAIEEATLAALRGSELTCWSHVGVSEKPRRNKTTKGSAKPTCYGASKPLPKEHFAFCGNRSAAGFF